MSTPLTPAAARTALTGPVASVSIPFTRPGEIDFAGLAEFVERSLAGGSRTIMLTFGDSLYSLLTDREVGEVTRAVVANTRRRALVIAADRVWATPKTTQFAREAREMDVDMLMVLPPDWAQSCTPDTLAAHYAAAAAEIPVMVVTNYMVARGEKPALAILERLRSIPGVMAVKDDFCGRFARQLGARFHHHWALISGGQKENHLNQHPYGCDGYLSTFVSLAPHIARRYWSALESKDLAAAVQVVTDVDMPFFDYLLALPGSFDAGMHGLMELTGISGRWRRKPYADLTDAQLEELRAFCVQLGII